MAYDRQTKLIMDRVPRAPAGIPMSNLRQASVYKMSASAFAFAVTQLLESGELQTYKVFRKTYVQKPGILD